MARFTRICLLLTPLALAGCDSMIDKLGNQMPVVGQRCQQAICLTDDDAQESQAMQAYNKAHPQAQQPQATGDSGYYAQPENAPQ